MDDEADLERGLRVFEDLNLFDMFLKNQFLEHRKHHDTTWMTLNGNIVEISDMNTRHIRSCLKLLEKADQTELPAYQGLSRELEKRSRK